MSSSMAMEEDLSTEPMDVDATPPPSSSSHVAEDWASILQSIKEETREDIEEEEGSYGMPPPSQPPPPLSRPRCQVSNSIVRRRSARLACHDKLPENLPLTPPPPSPPPSPQPPPTIKSGYRMPEYFKGDNHLPPETELSNFIEKRLKTVIPGYPYPILIREIYSDELVEKVEPPVQDFLREYLPAEIQYVKRSLVAFQKVADGGYVMFFYLGVQEYGRTCQSPYQNTVYIAMLDSVKTFEPSLLRTRLYYGILLSYLKYKVVGGTHRFFLWACPPGKDEEYVFNGRPKTQKTPTVKILSGWYVTMMQLAKRLGILESYESLYSWCPKKDSKQLFQILPYFPDDHWSLKITELVESLEKMRKDDEGDLIVFRTKLNPSLRSKLGRLDRKATKVAVSQLDYVAAQILEEMKSYKNDFFVMTSKEVDMIKESEQVLMPSRFTASRDNILTFQQKYGLVFCGSNNAIRSTTLLLQMLSISFSEILCNFCGGNFNSGERCQICQHLRCSTCAKTNPPHDHSSWMKIRLWKDSSPVLWNSRNTSNQGNESISWLTYFKNLILQSPPDPQAFKLYAHLKICKNKKGCTLCQKIHELTYHKPGEENAASSKKNPPSSSSQPTPPPSPPEEQGDASGRPRQSGPDYQISYRVIPAVK